jgi:hypothetical protein
MHGFVKNIDDMAKANVDFRRVPGPLLQVKWPGGAER